VSRLRGAYSIELIKIRRDPQQPRREFNEDELKNLTASVTERGIKQPVRVWFVEADQMYQIISGERRYRAAVAAGFTELPCIIEDAPKAGGPLPRREILVDQVVENWQRQDLNPYDLSDALKELRDDHHLSQNEIARVTGKPKSEISRFLAMQRVEASVQKAIREDPEGRYSRRHVNALAQLPPEEQSALAEKIQTDKLSAVETEQEVRRRKKSRDTGQAARGTPMSTRRYLIGSTNVELTFRKRAVTKTDILYVLARTRAKVEASKDDEKSE
jgi:ParB family transcriptional regulator, chromosome partitioning protein